MENIKIKIYPELKLVYFFGFGEFSCLYLMENIKKVHDLPGWDTDFNTFIDFENAIVSYLSDGFEEYQDFFINLQKDEKPRKWSIYTKQVITSQNASLSLMMQSQSIKVDVFQQRDMALDFLEIPEDKRDILNIDAIEN